MSLELDNGLTVIPGDLITVNTPSGKLSKEDFLVTEANGDIVTVTRTSQMPSEAFSSDSYIKLPPDQKSSKKQQIRKPEPLKRTHAPWKINE